MKHLKAININPKLQLILVISGFVGIGLGLVSAVSEKMNSIVEGPEIEIATTEYPYSMIAVSDIQEYIEKSDFSVKGPAKIKQLDLRKLEETLNKHPQVSKVKVYLNKNNIIRVKVYQKEPIFRIFSAQGKSYYLDKQGGEIPLSSHYTARIPVVICMDSKVDMTLLKEQLLKLKAEMVMNPFIGTLIDQIIVDDSGSFTLVPLVGDFKIKLGTTEDLRGKLNKLTTLYKRELIVKGWDYYKVIDLRFAGQIVAQKK